MKARTTHLIVFAVLTIAPLIAAPVAAGGLSHFGLHVGSHGFGLTFATTDWAVYGAAWDDAAWQPSYEVAFAGYGEWCTVSGLGRVWRPWVNAGWQPFSHGRWVWTEAGWTWVAYEPWGYYPHHYGDWALASFGWVWVPGWTYRPAPVTWVSYGSYVGWYPTPPRGWSHSSRAYHHGWHRGYDRGYADGWRDARHATWVPWRELGSTDVSRHAVAHHRVVQPSQGSRVQQVNAPARGDVTRRGVTIPETRLETRTVRSNGRDITVARPAGLGTSVERNGARTSQSALDRRALETRIPVSRESRSPSAARTSPPASTTTLQHRSDRSEVDRAQPTTRSPVQPRTRIEPRRSTASTPATRQPAAAARAASRTYRDNNQENSHRRQPTRTSRPTQAKPQPPSGQVDTRYRQPVGTPRSPESRGAGRDDSARSPRSAPTKPAVAPRVVPSNTKPQTNATSRERSARRQETNPQQTSRSPRKPR